MNRRQLYLIYTVLWAITLWLFYGIKPSGGNPLWILVLYGPPVFILYLFSAFLLDVREGAINGPVIRAFFKRRQAAIGLFLLALVILILLISLS
jgi:hypothetical protein